MKTWTFQIFWSTGRGTYDRIRDGKPFDGEWVVVNKLNFDNWIETFSTLKEAEQFVKETKK